MTRLIRILAILILIIGILSVGIGAAFAGIGISKNNLIVKRMNVEKVTIALDPSEPNNSITITNSEQAQAAADIISSHRRAMALTYQDLLAGGRFNPTNPQHLTYAQAMNLENYLYMAVVAFGLIQVAMGTGAFMIIAGIALVLTGVVLLRIISGLAPAIKA